MRTVETFNKWWESFVDFLQEYDAAKIGDVLNDVDWLAVLSNPITWVVALPVLGLLILRKQVKLIVLGISAVVFFVLLGDTLPGAGEAIPMAKLIQFIGGTVLLVAVNAYFFFMYE